MTFYAAGPAPLSRRPSKFTNPSERLAGPQQPIAQQRQRVASQSSPLPSLLTPHGQASWANPQDGPRQGRPKIQQVPLPGPWPGKSAQQQQQQPSQHAAPSHVVRRQSSRGEDAPLPPLPAEVGPLPSILRPGGPPRTDMQPNHETRYELSDPPVQERYPARTPPPSTANGAMAGAASYHHPTNPNPHPTYTYPRQNTPPFPTPLATQANIPPSSSQPQGQQHPDARRSSLHSTQGTPGHVGHTLGGYGNTQPSPQVQSELPRVQSQQPPQQQHHVQHSPRQQTQPSATQTPHHVPSYPPNSHSFVQPVQPYVAAPSPGSTPAAPSHTTSPSPSLPAHSFIASQSSAPPVQPHTATPSPVPLFSPTHPYTPATSNVVSSPPLLSATPTPTHFVPPPPPPPQHLTASSPIPHTQPYATNPVSSAQPFTAPMSPPPHAQHYVPSASPIPVPPVQSPAQSTTPSPPAQQYIPSASAHPMFPQPTSPPPMSSYSSSYTLAPSHSFPALSFPVPQANIDYFGTAATSTFSPQDEPNLPDPYLQRRYQAPLPLPPGASHPYSAGSAVRPQPKPPSPPAVRSSRRHENDEWAAREVQRREEEIARARLEQEERDAELARTLDRELNLDRDREDAQGRPGSRSHLPPRHAGMVNGTMPGEW
jgi:hypothetical protein